ncbi:hypothetical protein PQR64_37855 [Paraburkholderia phytofirmans]|uniref:hypothetical protein n=1 Tax=Paraburkholderia phytofirmans TaxID=261302 RepID=UPI0038BA1052
MNYLSALEQATVQLSTSYTAAEAINSLLTLFLAVAAIHAIVTFAAMETAIASQSFSAVIQETNVSAIDMTNLMVTVAIFA